MKELSRQRRWQLRKLEQGLCYICGKPQGAAAALCDEHALARRKQKRKLLGCKPWKAGKKGRPHIV